MSVNDYKDAIKAIIDSTDNEELLRHWKNHLEREYDEYQRQQTASTNSPEKDDKNDTSGYVVLESGLGIDE